MKALKKIKLRLEGYTFKKIWTYNLNQSEFQWQEMLLPHGWDVWSEVDVKYNKKRMTTMYMFEVYKKKKN